MKLGVFFSVLFWASLASSQVPGYNSGPPIEVNTVELHADEFAIGSGSTPRGEEESSQVIYTGTYSNSIAECESAILSDGSLEGNHPVHDLQKNYCTQCERYGRQSAKIFKICRPYFRPGNVQPNPPKALPIKGGNNYRSPLEECLAGCGRDDRDCKRTCKGIILPGCPEGCTESDGSCNKSTTECGGAGDPPTTVKACTRTTRTPLKLNDSAQEILKGCISNKDRKVSCCENPLSCMGNGNVSAEDAIGIMGLTQTILQINAQSKGLDATCKLNGQLANLSLGINAYAASYCSEKKISCESTCSESISEIEELVAECKCNRPGFEDACEAIQKTAQKATEAKEECALAINAARARVALNSINSLLAKKLSKDCRDAIRNQAPPLNFAEDKNRKQVSLANCSLKENEVLPHCLPSFCAKPANFKDAHCYTEKVAERPSFGSEDDGLRGDNKELSSLRSVADGEERQQLRIPPVSSGPNRSGAPGASPGGSGFRGLSLGAGGSSGAAAKDKKKQVAKKGDIKILKGFYKGRYVQRGTRGSQSYRRRGGKAVANGKISKSRKRFDLSKYLPRGKEKGLNRGLAKIESGRSSQVAGAHTNIWKQIHRRYIRVCKARLLQGCE